MQISDELLEAIEKITNGSVPFVIAYTDFSESKDRIIMGGSAATSLGLASVLYEHAMNCAGIGEEE